RGDGVCLFSRTFATRLPAHSQRRQSRDPVLLRVLLLLLRRRRSVEPRCVARKAATRGRRPGFAGLISNRALPRTSRRSGRSLGTRIVCVPSSGEDARRASNMTVRIEKDGPVWTVIHDRPEARNAMDPESADALTAAFLEFDRDKDASVAVFY